MGEKLIKILILDIETAPNLVHAWGLWDQSIGLNQIVKPTYTLCWAAKWLGKKQVFFRDHKEKEFVKDIYELLTEADAVVHFNGCKFDLFFGHTKHSFFFASNFEFDLVQMAFRREGYMIIY